MTWTETLQKRQKTSRTLGSDFMTTASNQTTGTWQKFWDRERGDYYKKLLLEISVLQSAMPDKALQVIHYTIIIEPQIPTHDREKTMDLDGKIFYYTSLHWFAWKSTLIRPIKILTLTAHPDSYQKKAMAKRIKPTLPNKSNSCQPKRFYWKEDSLDKM